MTSRRLWFYRKCVFRIGFCEAKKYILIEIQLIHKVILMGCWKWFNKVLKEADLTVSDKNEAKIEEIIHKYIGETSNLGKCSADWKKARVQIQENLEMKAELIAKLKTLA
jgi:hypothetical protein